MGHVPYNPKFRKAEIVIAFWNGMTKLKSNRKVSSRLLARTKAKAGISIDTSEITLAQAKSHRHQAYKDYYAIKKQQQSIEEPGAKNWHKHKLMQAIYQKQII